jgi:hypothetical protein
MKHIWKTVGATGLGIAGLALGYHLGNEAVEYATSLVDHSLSSPDVLSHVVSEYSLISKVISSLACGRLFSGVGYRSGNVIDAIIEDCKRENSVRQYFKERKKLGAELDRFESMRNNELTDNE